MAREPAAPTASPAYLTPIGHKVECVVCRKLVQAWCHFGKAMCSPSFHKTGFYAA